MLVSLIILRVITEFLKIITIPAVCFCCVLYVIYIGVLNLYQDKQLNKSTQKGIIHFLHEKTSGRLWKRNRLTRRNICNWYKMGVLFKINREYSTFLLTQSNRTCNTNIIGRSNTSIFNINNDIKNGVIPKYLHLQIINGYITSICINRRLSIKCKTFYILLQCFFSNLRRPIGSNYTLSRNSKRRINILPVCYSFILCNYIFLSSILSALSFSLA